jgi:hypothetical protein
VAVLPQPIGSPSVGPAKPFVRVFDGPREEIVNSDEEAAHPITKGRWSHPKLQRLANVDTAMASAAAHGLSVGTNGWRSITQPAVGSAP